MGRPSPPNLGKGSFIVVGESAAPSREARSHLNSPSGIKRRSAPIIEALNTLWATKDGTIAKCKVGSCGTPPCAKCSSSGAWLRCKDGFAPFVGGGAFARQTKEGHT